MKAKIFILLFIVIFPLFAYNQLQIDWQQCYGGSKYEGVQSVIKTGKSYMIFGYTESNDGDISYNHGKRDGWIVKTDSVGKLVWEKTYGGSVYDDCWDGFTIANSSNLYFVGSSLSVDGDITNNPYPGTENYWIVKMDTAGTIIWNKMVGGYGKDEVDVGTATYDGGVAAFGFTTSSDGDISHYYGATDMWMIKLDSLGNKDWDLTMGTSSFDYGQAIIQTSDHGFLLGGAAIFDGTDGNITCIPHGTRPEAVIVKTDSAGNIEWQNCYGGSKGETAIGLLETADGYLFSGIAFSNDGDVTGHHGDVDGDIWLVKLNFSGNIVWEHCFGGSYYEIAKNIVQTADGGYMVFGQTQSNDGDVSGNHSQSHSYYDIWVFKTDSIGNLLWQQCIGGTGNQQLFKGVLQLSDKQYVIAGTNLDYNVSGDVDCNEHGGDDYWLVKVTDTSTIVGVSESAAISKYKVYPNPARNYVILELPVKPIPPATLYLYDMYGRLITTLPVKAKKTVWDTRAVEPGVYLYTLKGGGLTKTGRIVIGKK